MPVIHIEWRKILKWAFVFVVIGMGVPLGLMVRTQFKAQVVHSGGPVPYTIITRETVHGPDGIARVGKEVIQAVRSDGSTVRRRLFPNPADGSERVVRFASGIEVSINEFTNTKSTVIKKVNPAHWQRDPSSKCINSFAGKPMTSMPEVISGEETIAGHRTVKITFNIERKVTAWYALDHGCAPVKDRIDFGGNEFSEHNLVALIPGEPEAALFDLPEYIKEVPPSTRVRGYSKVDRHCGEDCADKLRKMDESYYKHRVEK